MKCVANKDCQTRNSTGRIQFYLKGEVDEFLVCPPAFSPIEGEKAIAINFDKAGEAELLEGEFELDDLKEFIFLKYKKKAGNKAIRKTVELLLDCRFRDVDLSSLK